MNGLQKSMSAAPVQTTVVPTRVCHVSRDTLCAPCSKSRSVKETANCFEMQQTKHKLAQRVAQPA